MEIAIQRGMPEVLFSEDAVFSRFPREVRIPGVEEDTGCFPPGKRRLVF